MAPRRILMMLCLLAGSAVAVPRTSSQSVPEGYQRIARAHGVPAESLYSLALTESSRRLPRGERPWPWTINVAGKGYRYATRLDAWQALQGFIKSYPLKRIDVGVAQVNLGWNGQHFSSTWQAFEPYVNLNAAARILRECYDRNPGSWLAAAGCYHHPAGGKAAAVYTAIVTRKLAQLNPEPDSVSGFTSQPAAELASRITPDPDLVWTEPRSISR